MSTFSTSSPPLKDSFLRSHHASKIGSWSPDEPRGFFFRMETCSVFSTIELKRGSSDSQYSGGCRSLTHWTLGLFPQRCQCSSSYNLYHITNPLAPSSGQFWYDSFHTVDFVLISPSRSHFQICCCPHRQTFHIFEWYEQYLVVLFVNKCCIFHHHAFIHSLACCSTFSGKSLFGSSFVSIVFIVYVEKST